MYGFYLAEAVHAADGLDVVSGFQPALKTTTPPAATRLMPGSPALSEMRKSRNLGLRGLLNALHHFFRVAGGVEPSRRK